MKTPLIIEESDKNNLDEWLEQAENYLVENGYIKNHTQDEFFYHKSFGGYNIIIFLTDFRKYSWDISIKYRAIIADVDDIFEMPKYFELIINCANNMSLSDFEMLAENFYKAKEEYFLKTTTIWQ